MIPIWHRRRSSSYSLGQGVQGPDIFIRLGLGSHFQCRLVGFLVGSIAFSTWDCLEVKGIAPGVAHARASLDCAVLWWCTSVVHIEALHRVKM